MSALMPPQVTLPSGSLALALMVTFAGLVKAEPLVGDAMSTNGGWFAAAGVDRE